MTEQNADYGRCDECGDECVEVIGGRLAPHEYTPGAQCEGSYRLAPNDSSEAE
jgi:hypothetical protein